MGYDPGSWAGGDRSGDPDWYFDGSVWVKKWGVYEESEKWQKYCDTLRCQEEKREKAMNEKKIFLLENISKILLNILILSFLIFCYLVYRPDLVIKDGGLYIYFVNGIE